MFGQQQPFFFVSLLLLTSFETTQALFKAGSVVNSFDLNMTDIITGGATTVAAKNGATKVSPDGSKICMAMDDGSAWAIYCFNVARDDPASNNEITSIDFSNHQVVDVSFSCSISCTQTFDGAAGFVTGPGGYDYMRTNDAHTYQIGEWDWTQSPPTFTLLHEFSDPSDETKGYDFDFRQDPVSGETFMYFSNWGELYAVQMVPDGQYYKLDDSGDWSWDNNSPQLGSAWPAATIADRLDGGHMPYGMTLVEAGGKPGVIIFGDRQESYWLELSSTSLFAVHKNESLPLSSSEEYIQNSQTKYDHEIVRAHADNLKNLVLYPFENFEGIGQSGQDEGAWKISDATIAKDPLTGNLIFFSRIKYIADEANKGLGRIYQVGLYSAADVVASIGDSLVELLEAYNDELAELEANHTAEINALENGQAAQEALIQQVLDTLMNDLTDMQLANADVLADLLAQQDSETTPIQDKIEAVTDLIAALTARRRTLSMRGAVETKTADSPSSDKESDVLSRSSRRRAQSLSARGFDGVKNSSIESVSKKHRALKPKGKGSSSMGKVCDDLEKDLQELGEAADTDEQVLRLVAEMMGLHKQICQSKKPAVDTQAISSDLEAALSKKSVEDVAAVFATVNTTGLDPELASLINSL